MQYRLRTLLLLIAGSTPPIYAGCEGWKVNCLVPILLIWTGLVALPLMMRGFHSRETTSEDARDRVIAVLGAIAVLGYLCSIFFSVIIIGNHQPWRL